MPEELKTIVNMKGELVEIKDAPKTPLSLKVLLQALGLFLGALFLIYFVVSMLPAVFYFSGHQYLIIPLFLLLLLTPFLLLIKK